MNKLPWMCDIILVDSSIGNVCVRLKSGDVDVTNPALNSHLDTFTCPSMTAALKRSMAAPQNLMLSLFAELRDCLAKTL